jgi:hypothetical protein
MALKKPPHPEEAAKRPSRRTQRADPAKSRLLQQSRGAGEGKKAARNPAATPDQLIRTSKDGRIRLIQKRLPRLIAVARRKAR